MSQDLNRGKTNQVVGDEVESNGSQVFGFVEVAEDEGLDRVGDVQVVADGLFADGLKAEIPRLFNWAKSYVNTPLDGRTCRG